MMSIVRSALRGALAFLLPAAVPAAAANATPAPAGIAALLTGIEAQPALRARFANDPHATLREFGVDPAPFAIGTRLTDGDVDRILARWRFAQAGVNSGSTASGMTAQGAPPSPPEPVPPIQPPSPPSDTQGPPPAPPSPPAPVYGPPPSLRPR
jgi:hypothetical protein